MEIIKQLEALTAEDKQITAQIREIVAGRSGQISAEDRAKIGDLGKRSIVLAFQITALNKLVAQ